MKDSVDQTPTEEFQHLSIEGLTDADALDIIGKLIDSSDDHSSLEGLECGVVFCRELRCRLLAAPDQVLAYYFEANAWEALRRLRRFGDPKLPWEWEQPEYEQVILCLRHAHSLSSAEGVDSFRHAQIITNLANALSHVGRVVEALEYWSLALSVHPRFPMALANHGQGLFYLAERSHDPGHQCFLYKQARQELRQGLEEPMHDEARTAFSRYAESIESIFSSEQLDRPFDLNSFSLGSSSEESKYRRWCLQEGLFLNPLNELGVHSIAATDPLTLPSMTQPISTGPYYLGFFNQLKQEFSFARFTFFSGVTHRDLHYADSKVKMIDTLDAPVYSQAAERVKTCFRVAYGLFDKVAFFLNRYLNLGIPERRVNFKTLWYIGEERRHGLKPDLEDRRNISLLALFWLSKDLFEDKEGFCEALAPDARYLAEIRNHLEHKYLKLHETGWIRGDPSIVLVDTLAYSVARSDFQEKTLRVLKLARAALFYLTQCISLEERKDASGHQGIVVPIRFEEIDDTRRT